MAGELDNQGTAYQLGVKPTALDGLDSSDLIAPLMEITPADTAWCVGIHPDWGTGKIYSRDFQSPVLPSQGYKLWELRVGNLADFPQDNITLQIEFTTTALFPPLDVGDLFVEYRLYDANFNLLMTLDMEKIWSRIPNSEWARLTLPRATVTPQDSYDAWNTQAHKLYFYQGHPCYYPVPEPGSFLVLGSGLAGLIGFVRRHRRR